MGMETYILYSLRASYFALFCGTVWTNFTDTMESWSSLYFRAECLILVTLPLNVHVRSWHYLLLLGTLSLLTAFELWSLFHVLSLSPPPPPRPTSVPHSVERCGKRNDFVDAGGTLEGYVRLVRNLVSGAARSHRRSRMRRIGQRSDGAQPRRQPRQGGR